MVSRHLNKLDIDGLHNGYITDPFRSSEEYAFELIVAEAQDELSYRAGIKEVVDWIKSQRITPLPNKPSKGITFFSNVEFQNKIKDWGIE